MSKDAIENLILFWFLLKLFNGFLQEFDLKSSQDFLHKLHQRFLQEILPGFLQEISPGLPSEISLTSFLQKFLKEFFCDVFPLIFFKGLFYKSLLGKKSENPIEICSVISSELSASIPSEILSKFFLYSSSGFFRK